MALDHNSLKYQAFLEAIKDGTIEQVEEHLTIHPEFFDLANDYGNKPLHLAAQNGRDAMVEFLLQRGSTLLPFGPSVRSIDSTNNDGMAPLHYAVLNGHDSTVVSLRSGITTSKR